MIQPNLFDCNNLIIDGISCFIDHTIGAFTDFVDTLIALDLVASWTLHYHFNDLINNKIY